MTDEFEPTIDDYINRLKFKDDDEIRQNAVWVLGRYRDEPRIVEPLIDALEDESAGVRSRAAEVLGNLKDARVLMPLIQALKDEDSDVRVQAARSLGITGDVRAAEALLNVLHDPLAEVRSQAAESLSLLRHPETGVALAAALLNDDDANVRYFAAKGLIAMGGDEVVTRLVKALDTIEDPDRLIQLIETLAQMGDKSALDRLQAFTTHDDEGVQATAEWAVRLLRRQ